MSQTLNSWIFTPEELEIINRKRVIPEQYKDDEHQKHEYTLEDDQHVANFYIFEIVEKIMTRSLENKIYLQYKILATAATLFKRVILTFPIQRFKNPFQIALTAMYLAFKIEEISADNIGTFANQFREKTNFKKLIHFKDVGYQQEEFRLLERVNFDLDIHTYIRPIESVLNLVKERQIMCEQHNNHQQNSNQLLYLKLEEALSRLNLEQLAANSNKNNNSPTTPNSTLKEHMAAATHSALPTKDLKNTYDHLILRPLYDQIIFLYRPRLIALALLNAACELIEQPFTLIEQLLSDEGIVVNLDEGDERTRLTELTEKLLNTSFTPLQPRAREIAMFYLAKAEMEEAVAKSKKQFTEPAYEAEAVSRVAINPESVSTIDGALNHNTQEPEHQQLEQDDEFKKPLPHKRLSSKREDLQTVNGVTADEPELEKKTKIEEEYNSLE